MKPKIIPRPPKLDNSRAQFEQWLTKVMSYPDLRKSPDTSYENLDTDWLWKAWSAGRKSF